MAMYRSKGESRVVRVVKVYGAVEEVGRKKPFGNPLLHDLRWSSMGKWTLTVITLAILLFDVRLTNHPAFPWKYVVIHYR